MKQIWPNYSYSPTTNVLTLTGLNIDRDQLLLVSAPERGRIMYNFADSTTTASAFTAGANTGLTLVASTAGLTTPAALVIYYDDQLASSTVTVSSLPAISGTVTVGNTVNFLSGSDSDVNLVENIATALVSNSIGGILNALPAGTNRIGVVTIAAGTVTIGAGTAIIGNIDGVNTVLAVQDGSGNVFGFDRNFPVDVISALPAGTNRIGVVTIGGGTVTIGAGISQIGSVTASISSFATSVTARLINPAGTSVTYAEVGTAGNPSIDVLSVQGVTAGTPLNVYPMQGTTVSNTNFTSTTASTSLVSAVTGREVLTVFNEGAGNLHISPGATATTISYQVRLSSGDYWECPAGQLSLAHSAVFATAGTARVTQVS